MTVEQMQWKRAGDELVDEIRALGFPDELGQEIAKHLGSPKAMGKMVSYLQYVKPKTAELIVDEMLAIRSEIDIWREKKAAEEANAAYNEILNYGLTEEYEDEG